MLVLVLVLDLRLSVPNSNVGEGLDTGGSFPPDTPKNAAEKGVGTSFLPKLRENHTMRYYKTCTKYEVMRILTSVGGVPQMSIGEK